MSPEDQTLATAASDAAASGTAPAAVAAELVRELADLLQVKPEQIDPGQPFRALGFGSVRAVQFVSLVNRRYGTGLKATALVEHPTPLALAGLLAREAKVREQDARPLEQGAMAAGPGAGKIPGATAAQVAVVAEAGESPTADDHVTAEEVGALLDAVREDRLSVDEALTRLPQRA